TLIARSIGEYVILRGSYLSAASLPFHIFLRSRDRRHLRSFPTRRSSDLDAWLDRVLASGRPSLVCGDINIAHRAIDLTNWRANRSEEHTSELQSPCNHVCRLLLEKKKHPPLNLRVLKLVELVHSEACGTFTSTHLPQPIFPSESSLLFMPTLHRDIMRPARERILL